MTIKTRVYNYVGYLKTFVVPEGVTQARFELWGGAGGLGTGVSKVNPRVTQGGSAQPSDRYTNTPNDRGLGTNFANNGGYAAGTLNVTAGTPYYIAVGGNGQPGFSRIHPDGVVRNGDFVGGAGGWPDGGAGGHGWVTTQNLFNATSNPTPTFSQSGTPNATAIGQTWLNTATNVFYTATATGTTHWVQTTTKHAAVGGASGGGGGGATSLLTAESGTNARILVAGGSGGSGGAIINNGAGQWGVVTSASDGTAISPPFGVMNPATSPPLTTDLTWATVVDYLVASGWGVGGLGGATGPANAATTNVDPTQPNNSKGSAAGNGGQATGMRPYNTTPNSHTPVTTGAGQGGTGQSAGLGGVTAGSASVTPAQNGDANNSLIGNVSGGGAVQGSGGNGANGHGTRTDDWNCGGGGGGGGFHGGGGGGAGYYGPAGSDVSKGGGGGGGSNFALNAFSNVVLLGGARPPAAIRDVSQGAGGMGGFARITYHAPPSCVWNLVPAGFDQSIPAPVQFRFNSSGADIYSFDIGYNTVLTATAPSVFTTVLVDANSLVPGNSLHGTTHIAYKFPAGTFTTGTPYKLFVRATDMDGKPNTVDPVQGTGNNDTSAWAISSQINPEAHSVFAPATITTPANNATDAPGNIPVTWTVGTQTPLVAYRLRLVQASTGKQIANSGWQAGGNRVNLALDPGFINTAGATLWTTQGTVLPAYAGNDATMPGISAKNGKVTWAANNDGSARALSPLFTGLTPGGDYRVHLKVGSNTANDTEPLQVAILDPNFNIIQSHPVNLSAIAANTGVVLDFHFTMPNPHTSAYVAIVPSDSTGTLGNSDASRITYLADFLLEPGVVGDGGNTGTYTNGYYDGGHANGNTGTTSWVGTANASPSLLTGADIVTDAANLNCNAVLNGLTLSVDTISQAAAINGHYVTATSTLNVNQSQPVAPTVSLTVDNNNGYMALTMVGVLTGTWPCTSFNVYRTEIASGVETRVGTNIKPDQTTGIARFQDIPADGEQVTYRVEAVSTGGGTTSTTAGTVAYVG